MKRKVLVFGTFDGLHKGHLDLFKQARKFGDSFSRKASKEEAFLIAVVARDSTVIKNKGKMPKYGEKERLKKTQECDLVNEAIWGRENHDTQNDSYDLIKEINPDIICLGYDQVQFVEKLKNELKRMNLKVKIKVLKPYKLEIYKSSILNNK